MAEIKDTVIKTSGLRKLELLEKLSDIIVKNEKNANDAIASIADCLATIETGNDQGLKIIGDCNTISGCHFVGLETGMTINTPTTKLTGTNTFDAPIKLEASTEPHEVFHDEDYDEYEEDTDEYEEDMEECGEDKKECEHCAFPSCMECNTCVLKNMNE